MLKKIEFKELFTTIMKNKDSKKRMMKWKIDKEKKSCKRKLTELKEKHLLIKIS